jgi:LCP family protein required for cell wall assembly
LTTRAHAVPRSSPRNSPQRALLLSALWPGLGQWYLRQPRPALILALPPLLVFLPLLLTVPEGAEGLIGYLVVPRNAMVLTAAVTISLICRLVSMALVVRRLGAPSNAQHRTTLVVLLVVVTLSHLVAGYLSIGLFGVTSRVFGGSIPTTVVPNASGSPEPGVGTLPSAPPPLPDNQRLTVLLIGSDSGTGYNHALTDTMMVVSIDPTTNKVVMASLPRDIARFEMFDGSVFNGKLNSLMTQAERDKAKYPEGGAGTLAHEIGYLIGIPIQYIAYIDMAGFEKAIEAVGGVDVNVTRAINDNVYTFPDGKKGFHLSAGKHHLDGRQAVAYVRSRYGPGDSDFTRARRQQELLLALRTKLLSPSSLPNVPRVLDEVSRFVTTNFPPEEIGKAIDLAKAVDADSMTRSVLGPPYAIHPAGGGEYVLVPDMERIAAWSRKAFGADSRYASP